MKRVRWEGLRTWRGSEFEIFMFEILQRKLQNKPALKSKKRGIKREVAFLPVLPRFIIPLSVHFTVRPSAKSML